MANETEVSFSGDEFLHQLLNDEIAIPMVFTGTVKKPDVGTDHFLFAPGSDCEHWLKIPVTSVEAVEVLDVVSCKDHTHPLVKLRFKRPQSEEGSLFLALAQLSLVAGRMSHRPLADASDADRCFDRYVRLCKKWFKTGPRYGECIERAIDMCDW
jgi:hypothetical protein